MYCFRESFVDPCKLSFYVEMTKVRCVVFFFDITNIIWIDHLNTCKSFDACKYYTDQIYLLQFIVLSVNDYLSLPCLCGGIWFMLVHDGPLFETSTSHEPTG